MPPACVTQAFDDVPCASPFAPWINELALRGVTAGCGDGSTYCPTDPTNRQQMAVFLLKTKEGSSYVPPACTVATFGDVPCDSTFAPWIYELVNRGVTAGCGGGQLLPDRLGGPAADGGLPRQDVRTLALRALIETHSLRMHGRGVPAAPVSFSGGHLGRTLFL